MGFSDYTGPVRVDHMAEGVTLVRPAYPADSSRFVPAGQYGELPELFLCITRNNPNGLGIVLDVTRLVPLGDDVPPRLIHVLHVLLDHGGWRDVCYVTTDDMPVAGSLGHELIRHGFEMANRETLHNPPPAPDFPADAPEPGRRVAGWERYPGRPVWFTYVYRYDV